jgi:hypothetical protein
MQASTTTVTVIQAQPAQRDRAGLNLEVAGSGGFSGFIEAEALQQPAYDCNTNDVCTAVPDSVDLVRNTRYVWQPALSVGLVFRYGRRSGIGAGVGGHMVFVPNEGGTRPLPAFTIHVGSESHQLFGGLILGSSDAIQFPNGRDRFRVGSDSVPSFVRRNAGKGPNYFFGIVLEGKSLLGPRENGDRSGESGTARQEER